jgi:hypothetical protein
MPNNLLMEAIGILSYFFVINIDQPEEPKIFLFHHLKTSKLLGSSPIYF